MGMPETGINTVKMMTDEEINVLEKIHSYLYIS